MPAMPLLRMVGMLQHMSVLGFCRSQGKRVFARVWAPDAGDAVVENGGDAPAHVGPVGVGVAAPVRRVRAAAQERRPDQATCHYTTQRMSVQLDLVSPLQCAAYEPLPRNVDLIRHRAHTFIQQAVTARAPRVWGPGSTGRQMQAAALPPLAAQACVHTHSVSGFIAVKHPVISSLH